MAELDSLSAVHRCSWGKLLGRHHVAPHISPHKTWEGLIGGIISAAGIGTALWWMTPITMREAAFLSLGISSMGFMGGIIMSAIKRDAGVKDFGATIAGHGESSIGSMRSALLPLLCFMW